MPPGATAACAWNGAVERGASGRGRRAARCRFQLAQDLPPLLLRQTGSSDSLFSGSRGTASTNRSNAASRRSDRGAVEEVAVVLQQPRHAAPPVFQVERQVELRRPALHRQRLQPEPRQLQRRTVRGVEREHRLESGVWLQVALRPQLARPAARTARPGAPRRRARSPAPAPAARRKPGSPARSSAQRPGCWRRSRSAPPAPRRSRPATGVPTTRSSSPV